MEIKFQPYTTEDLFLKEPEPAIKHLPDWYKTLSPYTSGSKDRFGSDRGVNLTVKRCNPVGDALGAGYLIFLENSITVKKSADGPIPELIWLRGGEDFIGQHPPQQFPAKIIPEGYSKVALKFKNFWSIQTPKNYSVLITHPINRYDLPFITLSGIVDTDTYHAAINFPFFIRKDFEGVIHAGTPIAQVIPFRRESWTRFIKPFSKEFTNRLLANRDRYGIKFYKMFNWQRKEWK